MVDFRYHALSLVAVFLALGIGIVLGVTVGDSLVSDADRNLRDSLRGDVEEAREQVRDAEGLAESREEVIDEIAPELAAGRLRGRRIALIALGELPVEVADGVEEAVEIGSGRLVRRAEITPGEWVESADLAPAPGARGRAAGYRRSGVLIARAIESGNRLLRQLARIPGARWFSGSSRGPVDAIVVYSDPPAEDEAEEDRVVREALAEGVFRRLRDNVIGVESLATDPSQIAWLADDRVAASVDNVDVPAGRLALVLLLEQAAVAGVTNERPEGSFGYKDSADRPIPELGRAP